MGLADADDESKHVRWNPKRKNFNRVKQFFGHFGLYVALILYVAAGAWVFQKLEYGEEIQKKLDLKQKLDEQKLNFTNILLNTQSSEPGKFNVTLQGELEKFVNLLEELRSDGLNLSIKAPNEIEEQASWRDFTKSAFFASTVLTTIGYGDMAPETRSGRGFCMVFAMIGIPFTLTVIADVGKLMASAVNKAGKRIRASFPKTKLPKESKLQKIGKSAWVVAVLLVFLLYVLFGGWLFTIWEAWDLFDSIYFCFITMTTIGLGDLVPGETSYMIQCVYIMIGLALTSTSIELVQRLDYMKKMREFSTRLQGLSGPLADTLAQLKKRGDNINLDVKVLQDLKDVLAMSSGKQKREGSIWKKFWESEDGYEDNVDSNEPRLIQIIIYESSV